ncbi:hypothetical protein [Kiloniella majae]|uniref:hypothetical protein n=1 Tax=Kiloniella majae TaxID=1938558 RepID=UPI000A2774C9|nr:hypothetical protein [Kiloniella majae]
MKKLSLISGIIIAVALLTACAKNEYRPVPSATLFEDDSENYFVKSIIIKKEPNIKSEEITEHLKTAFKNLPVSDQIDGVALELSLLVTDLRDPKFFGGDNKLSSTIVLTRQDNQKKEYEISLNTIKASRGGNTWGLIAELIAEDEAILANQMVELIKRWVLDENKLKLSKEAI